MCPIGVAQWLDQRPRQRIDRRLERFIDVYVQIDQAEPL